jgi:diguanylate cyclase (GGDEF)-like protein
VRLTDEHRPARRTDARLTLSASWAVALTASGFLGVFLIDQATGAVPFQHLYYLPIIFAALQFGHAGAWMASLSAVALYHLANPDLLHFAHGERDIVQIALFIVVGALTARLRADARRLETLAATDGLTGLLNLGAFEERLRIEVHRARSARAALSLLVVDLDALKALNDAHGHLAGAEAVRAVGHIIASHLPEAAFACRYGGDEFVVALPGQASPAAEGTASAILRTVRAAAPVLAGVAFPPATISVSIGLACLDQNADGDAAAPGDDAAGEALFRAADSALYEAKRRGRARVCVA